MNRSISRQCTSLGLALCCLVLAACGTGRTMITAAPEARYVAASLTIQEGTSTVAVPTEVNATLQKLLAEALHGKAGFARGTDLTLRYRFVQYSAGDRFQRWFWGGVGNSGEGSMTIESVYVDRTGAEKAKIMSEGRIGSGFFGGSMDSALGKVAEEITKFTIENFR
jgi:hypothetical protein